jgi:hypothetical protein
MGLPQSFAGTDPGALMTDLSILSSIPSTESSSYVHEIGPSELISSVKMASGSSCSACSTQYSRTRFLASVRVAKAVKISSSYTSTHV